MAGFSFGTPTTSAPSFSFGNTTSTPGASGINFGSPAPNPATTTLQFNTPGHSSGSVTFAAPAAQAGGGLTFGSPGGLNIGIQAATQGSLSFKPGGLGGGLNFGASSTQQPSLSFGGAATTAPTLPTFGSAPAANQQTLSFGSTPGTSQPLTFGSTPATSQPLSFGSTPATSQPLSFGSTPATSQPLSFGSTPATSQPLSFGSTPATSQPLSFGSTPATSQPLSFGSTPATSQPLSFGNAPATTQPLSFGSSLATTQPLNFGATPTTQPPSFGSTLGSTQPGLTFGSTPATTQARVTPATSQPLTFGAAAPATTTPGLSFGLGGQPATTKPTVSFGLSTTTAAATTASTLLNFSAPKTTASTGFSLTVSSTGTGTLFSAPTTSAVPTTTAAPVFKGLGGIDTSSTQGAGQKDAKSVKENTVFPELMPTLDTLKNFVKQQKSLSCEVSRAPVKPMHKVTEDTEALRQMLTSVASALQKNRVAANKLKIDTTKCLALSEMAQRTHDTPPGLQNDNGAPLEFFVELVSKFERDIQVLRQEIDNTEKHVNSLAYPAILTPQELSIALRRLHDSFVALAGRLQTAHSGVNAQKERHLSLRRHFLKDTTNIFENSSKAAASTKKQQYINVLPMTGPTPFSSLSGGHNINLMTGQDKPVTFSTGTNSISGWGTSAATNFNNVVASPNFLNTAGSTLNNQQAVENQNFQLGKPPPGNKRGKR